MKLTFNIHAVLQFALFVGTNAAAQGLLPDIAAKWVVLIVSGAQMAFGLVAHTRDKYGEKINGSQE